jgi:hypothetical protein
MKGFAWGCTQGNSVQIQIPTQSRKLDTNKTRTNESGKLYFSRSYMFFKHILCNSDHLIGLDDESLQLAIK